MSESDLEKKPSFLQIVLTAFAAAFGVQSDKNRARDFKHGSVLPYIIAGVVFTVIFVLTVVFIVKLVLGNAGV